jgi:hypothetical protein
VIYQEAKERIEGREKGGGGGGGWGNERSDWRLLQVLD